MIEKLVNDIYATNSIEEASVYFSADSEEESKEVIYNNIKALGEAQITDAVVLGTDDGITTVMFYFTGEYVTGSTKSVILLKENEAGETVVYANNALIEPLLLRYACPTCYGSGVVPSSKQITCAICGGTGQQYASNLLYDAVQGWQDGFTTCSGCEGRGFTYGQDTCSTCNGTGINPA